MVSLGDGDMVALIEASINTVINQAFFAEYEHLLAACVNAESLVVVVSRMVCGVVGNRIA